MSLFGDGIFGDYFFLTTSCCLSPSLQGSDLAWSCESPEPHPPQCVFLQSSTRAADSDGWGGSSLPREHRGKEAALFVTVVFVWCVRNRMRGPCPLLQNSPLLSQPFRPCIQSYRL